MSGVRWAFEFVRRKEAMRKRAQTNRQGEEDGLSEVVSLFNPINSLGWWYKAFQSKAERNRQTDIRMSGKEEERRFRRRHNNIAPVSRRKSAVFYESDDWRPKYFSKLKNHKMTS